MTKAGAVIILLATFLLAAKTAAREKTDAQGNFQHEGGHQNTPLKRFPRQLPSISPQQDEVGGFPSQNEDRGIEGEERQEEREGRIQEPTISRQNDAASSSRQNEGVSSSHQNEGVLSSRQNEGVSSSRQNEGVSSSRQNEGVSSSRQNEGVSSSRQNEGRVSSSRQNQMGTTLTADNNDFLLDDHLHSLLSDQENKPRFPRQDIILQETPRLEDNPRGIPRAREINIQTPNPNLNPEFAHKNQETLGFGGLFGRTGDNRLFGKDEEWPWRSNVWGEDERYLNTGQRQVLRMFGRDDPVFLGTRSTYIILAPRIARPSTVYRIVVGILSGHSPVQVSAQMASSAASLSATKALIEPGNVGELLIKVPHSSTMDDYTLQVEGRRGHSVIFRNTTMVHSTPTFLTILIHLNRPAYTGNQDVGVRVLLLTTDLKPYEEPIDAFILDPNGYIVKRWVSRTPQIGVVSVAFTLPDLPSAGWWKVRVWARGQEEEKKFFVEKVWEPLYEAFIEMPFYGLPDDEAIEGTITGSFTNDKPVYGNATISLSVKQPWTRPDSEFKYVDSQYFEYVEEEEDFAFPMESLLPHVEKLENAEVKVELVFHDFYSHMRADGRSRMRILGDQVQVGVVGTEPFIFRPGMPFSGAVTVKHSDGEPVDAERLAESTLTISPTITSAHGNAPPLPQIIIPALSERTTFDNTALYMLNEYQDSGYWLPEADKNPDEDRDKDVWEDGVWLNEIDIAERELQNMVEEYTKEQYFSEYRETGLFRFKIDVPEGASSIRIDVTYRDETSQASASVVAHAHYNNERKYIQVTSSTDEAKIGEFVVLHVRTNFHCPQFVYMVTSKGMILYTASEVTNGDDVVTLSVAVSSTMSPTFTIVVYATTDEGEILADALTVPVKVFGTMDIKLAANQHKDHLKKTVEIVTGAPPGSFYALICQRGLNYIRQHPNALSHSRIIDQLTKMEPMQRTVHGVLNRWRDGEAADRLTSLPASSYARDTLGIFQDASLVLLTDAVVPITPGRGRICDSSRGFLECGDGSCFRHDQLCDGVINCIDGSDELGCDPLYTDFPLDHDKQEDPLELTSDALFRLFRTQLILDIFDEDDVEWCNAELWIGHRGQEELQRELAKTVEDWVLEAYALHPDYGLAYTAEPLPFSTDPPFYMLAEGPSVCRRGEQVSIRLLLYNVVSTTLQALIVLHASDDYKFVHVEKDGEVQHYSPRIEGGEHQHLVFIPPEGLKEVVIPLAITAQSGTVEIVIDALTQVRKDTEAWEIEVLPEGVPVRKHTSLVLDLRNRALVYEFLDVPVDESPIIPFSLERRFMYGSPAAQISVAGDVFGPTPEGIAVDYTEVFGGRHFRSTDGVAFNFGATLWTLHYLRLTNQLDVSESRDAFDYLTVQLAGLLWRYDHGGFSMWEKSPPSVWVTAKVINMLLAAQHEDWENFLYIDPKIIGKSVEFLMKHQSIDGGFAERNTSNLDSKMTNKDQKSSVSLTALVTIVIHNSLSSLQGDTHSKAVDARNRARQYLHIQLPNLIDVYDLAITTYALTLLGSPSADYSASMLDGMKRHEGDMAYWSKERITTHPRRQENNQRAFLLPREPEKWDAHAVEATSYALLVFLTRQGVTTYTERIMRWLNAVRDWDFAFISTVDSLVAMQALAEYAYRARLRDVTNLQCSLEITAQPQNPFELTITNESLSVLHSFELENVWGHVNLVAKGSGQGVAQMEVSWGVDVLRFIEQPHKKYFDLTVMEKYHQFRNKSLITTTVCAKWIALEDANMSSAAMVEVEVPTGYMLFQPLADNRLTQIHKDGNFPQLRNVHTTDTHVFWQFEYVPSDMKQCFTYDLQRWFPAANLTYVRAATIMELFAPEHFEMVMINSTPLAALDICEVCGSYQCPYCPAYNSAWSPFTPASTTFILFISTWVLSILCIS